MLEEFIEIEGIEVTAGVLEDSSGQLITLPPTEIVPQADFFDYDSKYIAGRSQEITSARLSQETFALFKNTRALRIKHWVVVWDVSNGHDVNSSGHPMVLEINTISGLTETSLLPQPAAAHGFSFSQMVNMMLNSALRR